MIYPLASIPLGSPYYGITLELMTVDEIVGVVEDIRSSLTIPLVETVGVVEDVPVHGSVLFEEHVVLEERTRGIDKDGMDLISWRRTEKEMGGDDWVLVNKNY